MSRDSPRLRGTTQTAVTIGTAFELEYGAALTLDFVALKIFTPYSLKKVFRGAGIQSPFFYVYMGPFVAANTNGDLAGYNPFAGTLRISHQNGSIQGEIMKNKIAVWKLAVLALTASAAFAGSESCGRWTGDESHQGHHQ